MPSSVHSLPVLCPVLSTAYPHSVTVCPAQLETCDTGASSEIVPRGKGCNGDAIATYLEDSSTL